MTATTNGRGEAASISGVTTPDSKLVREATELIRDTEPPLLFRNGSLTGGSQLSARGRSAEHRHPGFIVGYVLKGQIRFAINHETPRVLRRGEMFYEPTGALHSTPENAQLGMPAKILAFMVAPPGRPVVEGK
jgi:hypothetical protein